MEEFYAGVNTTDADVNAIEPSIQLLAF